MSTLGVKTGTPIASTRSASEPTIDSTRSMSWIIRSWITETSVPRSPKPAIRRASMNLGFRTHCRALRIDGENLSVCPVHRTTLRAAPPAPARHPCSTVEAIGFSIRTCRPCVDDRLPDLVMGAGGHRDAHGVNLSDQGFQRRVGLGAFSLGDLLRPALGSLS